MGEWVGYVMSVGLLFLTVTFGFSLAGAQGAKATLTRIANVAANEMSVEGGYTSQVQQTIIQNLQSDGFNPQDANVQVTPIGVRVSYGSVMKVTISYPVPIRIVDVAPFDVGVSDTSDAVSMYVNGSPASNDPILTSPGQGTGDLQGNVNSGKAKWQG